MKRWCPACRPTTIACLDVGDLYEHGDSTVMRWSRNRALEPSERMGETGRGRIQASPSNSSLPSLPLACIWKSSRPSRMPYWRSFRPSGMRLPFWHVSVRPSEDMLRAVRALRLPALHARLRPRRTRHRLQLVHPREQRLVVARLRAQHEAHAQFLQQPDVRPVRRQAVLDHQQRQVRMLPTQRRQQTLRRRASARFRPLSFFFAPSAFRIGSGGTTGRTSRRSGCTSTAHSDWW